MRNGWYRFSLKNIKPVRRVENNRLKSLGMRTIQQLLKSSYTEEHFKYILQS